jgi:ABC-type uncharacterized transport system ATPase subunit
MRCEVAASLLHRPKLLLLDEPSIGLDVVAKQHIRDAIKRMNQEEGVGVLLTSHDAGDLEAFVNASSSSIMDRSSMRTSFNLKRNSDHELEVHYKRKCQGLSITALKF